MSAIPPNNLVRTNSNSKNSSAGVNTRITHQLSGRSIPTALCAMRESAEPRVRVGTDVLDFTSFPEDPHVLITNHLRRVGNLLPGVESGEYPGYPPWHEFVLNEALKVVYATCTPVLRRSVLSTSQDTSAKCHLLASLIPARYFPGSGTVADRFFTGLSSFLKNQRRFSRRHGTDIAHQQEHVPGTSPQTSNAGRKRVRHRSNSQPKRRKPRPTPKVSPNTSVPALSDETKQDVSTSEYAPEAPSTDKRDRKMETSPDTIRATRSRKRKSLNEQTPPKAGTRERASTGDPTPSKKKNKKEATRTFIEPTAPSAPSPLPEIIKLEDSSDEESDETSGAESDHVPPPRTKRNVYEYMYHNAQEDISFFERFLQQGAGISKADIDASKIRVAMGQSHKKAFDQVFKPRERKPARHPKTPEQD